MEKGSSERPESEGHTSNLYAFGVASGRIIKAKRLCDGRSVTIDSLKQSDILDSNGNFTREFTSHENVNCVYDDNGIKLYSIGKYMLQSQKRELEWYVMYVSGEGNNYSLRYKSPVDYSKEEVEARVQIINDVWEAAGITCKRTHLTFDTVAENESEINDATNAQIMAQTGLSILKNTNTQDAEYIYRDLKEMLIELGYYTEAEFDVLDSNVLMWLIPDYIPTTWPQNSGNDVYEPYALLYAKSEEQSDDQTEEERQRLMDLGIETDKSLGFESDLSIIAPGDCRIISKGADGVEIEFTGEEEPEIGMLEGYTMIIQGMNTSDGITLIDEDGAESTISYDAAITQKTLIKEGSIIGKTGTTNIKITLLNDRGEYLSNIEDYMAPDLNSYQNEFTSDYAYFYWLPYEGGSDDPGVVSVLRPGAEVAVGIAQWTTLSSGTNNIPGLCAWLYNKDPQLCAELNAFSNFSNQQVIQNIDQIRNAFRIVANRNQTKLFELEMQYCFEEKAAMIENKVPWLLEKNPVTVGTYISLLNWGPGLGWEDVVSESMTDEQIIRALLKKATTIGSTMGSLTPRWESQAKLAIDILNGRFTDIEGWIRNKAGYPEYGEGNNPGFLK